MTKCSWKTGLFLLAGAFILTFSASAFAADIMEYSGGNKAVKAKVDEFNQLITPVSKSETAGLEKELKEKQDQCDKLRSELYSMTNVRWSIGNNVRNWGWSVDDKLSSAIGNKLDILWEQLETLWSTSENDGKDLEAQLEYFAEAALKHAKTPERRIQIQKEYGELKQIIDKIKSVTEKMNSVCGAAKTLRGVDGNQDVYKYLDPKTGAEFLFIKENDGTLKTVGGVLNGCIPLPAKLAEGRSCLFCPLFKKVFNAAQEMTTKSYSVLAASISNVLLVGFSLWVAFSLLGKVSSFTKMDAPKYITELLTQAFKVLIAYLLLRDATAVYAYIIGPILKAGMEFGMTLLSSGDNAYLNACDNKGALKGLAGGMLPAYLYSQLECFIQAVQAELAIPQSIGSSMMCFARNAGSTDLGLFKMVTDYRLPDFSILLQGAIIWVFAWLLSLAFAFYLIDATVRLGIVGALMPFLIASWPFKMTSKYTSTGFTMFMNTFFTYVFMGLVVSVNIRLMGESLSGVEGGFKAIEDALNGNSVTVLKDILDIGFAGFLILIASCIFGFKLTGQATELAGSMAGGGGGTSIAPQIGGMGASVAKAGALGAGKMTWGGAKILGNATGVTPKLRQARDKAGAKVAGWLGFGGGSSGGAASTPTTSTSPTTPNKPAPAPTTPSNNPPVTNNQQQQAEKLENAEPRQTPSTQTPSTQTPLTQTPSTQPTPTTANQQQTTTSQQPSSEEQKLSPAELQNKFVKEFENTNTGNAINRAISSQTEYRNSHQATIDSLRRDQEAATKDAEYYRQAANAARTSPETKKQYEDRQREETQKANDLIRQISAVTAEKDKCDNTINSLNELKNNTAAQYASHKIDPKNNPKINSADVVNQVNNMTI